MERTSMTTQSEYDIVCHRCNRPAKVPFQPLEDTPVFCSRCYAKIRAAENVWFRQGYSGRQLSPPRRGETN